MVLREVGQEGLSRTLTRVACRRRGCGEESPILLLLAGLPVQASSSLRGVGVALFSLTGSDHDGNIISTSEETTRDEKGFRYLFSASNSIELIH